ncbi:MAG: hypothetical protein IJR53_07995 [Bacteroidales bacterium]|nr:hypothetical protein [Bacteroidales bacterium]
MKLESLNNSKYSLTPEKMGELVGGKQMQVCTGSCTVNGTACSCDMYIYANQQDYNNHIATVATHYSGSADFEARSRDWKVPCNCASVI